MLFTQPLPLCIFLGATFVSNVSAKKFGEFKDARIIEVKGLNDIFGVPNRQKYLSLYRGEVESKMEEIFVLPCMENHECREDGAQCAFERSITRKSGVLCSKSTSLDVSRPFKLSNVNDDGLAALTTYKEKSSPKTSDDKTSDKKRPGSSEIDGEPAPKKKASGTEKTDTEMNDARKRRSFQA